MPSIKEEVFLECAPEVAFGEVSTIDFARKIGFDSGISNEVLYQNGRIIRYNFKITIGDNVRSIESERILIPENLTIITQRRNLLSAKYNVIIDFFKRQGEGTIMTHVDEFGDQSMNSSEALINMRNTTKMYLDKIKNYFHHMGNIAL